MNIKFEMRRVILFTSNMEEMVRFYSDVLGLELVESEKGWKDYKAGACNISLHAGRSDVGKRPPKITFYASDVSAARAALILRGATRLGEVISAGAFDMCDGKDPDGNAFQISGRK